MKPIWKTILWLTAFSIAMGYLEAAIVVYLRMLYYPDGFKFPLKVIDHNTAITEFWREAASIIMLYGTGWLAGKNKQQRFAFFLYNFAIWDLFYYVFLKVILNWPGSLFTWDILFLIPVPWVGPVLAPCILSLSMALYTATILYFNEKDSGAAMSGWEKKSIALGCIVVVAACIQDYIANLYAHNEMGEMFNIFSPKGNAQLFADFASYVPKSFDWWLFGAGEILILLAIALYFVRQRRVLAQREERQAILNNN